MCLIKVQLSSCKPGAYVRFRDDENAPIWIKNHYDRSSKSYSLTKYDDACHEVFRKKTVFVFVYADDIK